jgi:hypothetical protein
MPDSTSSVTDVLLKSNQLPLDEAVMDDSSTIKITGSSVNTKQTSTLQKGKNNVLAVENEELSSIKNIASSVENNQMSAIKKRKKNESVVQSNETTRTRSMSKCRSNK